MRASSAFRIGLRSPTPIASPPPSRSGRTAATGRVSRVASVPSISTSAGPISRDGGLSSETRGRGRASQVPGRRSSASSTSSTQGRASTPSTTVGSASSPSPRRTRTRPPARTSMSRSSPRSGHGWGGSSDEAPGPRTGACGVRPPWTLPRHPGGPRRRLCRERLRAPPFLARPRFRAARFRAPRDSRSPQVGRSRLGPRLGGRRRLRGPGGAVVPRGGGGPPLRGPADRRNLGPRLRGLPSVRVGPPRSPAPHRARPRSLVRGTRPRGRSRGPRRAQARSRTPRGPAGPRGPRRDGDRHGTHRHAPAERPKGRPSRAPRRPRFRLGTTRFPGLAPGGVHARRASVPAGCDPNGGAPARSAGRALATRSAIDLRRRRRPPWLTGFGVGGVPRSEKEAVPPSVHDLGAREANRAGPTRLADGSGVPPRAGATVPPDRRGGPPPLPHDPRGVRVRFEGLRREGPPREPAVDPRADRLRVHEHPDGRPDGWQRLRHDRVLVQRGELRRRGRAPGSALRGAPPGRRWQRIHRLWRRDGTESGQRAGPRGQLRLRVHGLLGGRPSGGGRPRVPHGDDRLLCPADGTRIRADLGATYTVDPERWVSGAPATIIFTVQED